MSALRGFAQPQVYGGAVEVGEERGQLGAAVFIQELGLPESLDNGGILRRLGTQCERGDEE